MFLFSCEATPKCGLEGEEACRPLPCSSCEELTADELTEEERAYYNMSLQDPPTWMVGRWSGSFAGDVAIPAFTASGEVVGAAGDSVYGAKFFVPRPINWEEDDWRSEEEIAACVEPQLDCKQVNLPLRVDWTLRFGDEEQPHRTAIYLDDTGKTIRAPDRLPFSVILTRVAGEPVHFVLGFAPDGALWVSSEIPAPSGAGGFQSIGQREAAD
jgi:hypothetical protein